VDTSTDESIEVELHSKFARLKDAANKEPYPTLAVRQDRLRRAIDVLAKNEKRIVDAVNADFGGQPEALSLLVDVMAPTRSLKHALKNVERWRVLSADGRGRQYVTVERADCAVVLTVGQHIGGG
jgi:coniferyl-aldehyde dehydrogenase